nr:unnamed protein product [Callosobruchus analis]
MYARVENKTRPKLRMF